MQRGMEGRMLSQQLTAWACSSWMGGGGALSAPCRSRALTRDTATPWRLR